MSILGMALTILGLAVFETVSSVDNAIINAEVLSGMGAKARRWFLLWGILFAVFVVRGLLPWVIVWLALPGLGPFGAFAAAFSSDPRVHEAVEAAAPILLMGGGVFLVLLFLHWTSSRTRSLSWVPAAARPIFPRTCRAPIPGTRGRTRRTACTAPTCAAR